MNFCNQCGATVSLQIPENDNRQRYVCDECHTIHYQNPNIVAGILPIFVNSDGKDKVLLCRRAIEPRYGLWTLPAGFMENSESVEQAACREAEEEANLSVENRQLYMVMSLPHISQVYMLFIGQISQQDYAPGIESLEVKLFSEKDIPWQELAFPVITQSLQCYFEDRKTCIDGQYPLHNMVYQKPNIQKDNKGK
jgi:ADP-ribose pyrophosphatase YjhB (NUDIX family)